MSAELHGRVALVSGGSRDIGRAICIELARRGAAVAVNYRRDEDAARATVAEIEAAGGTALPVRASVGEREAVDAMVEQARAALGPIDLLVCNAGVASRGDLVVDTDPDEPERVIRTHALGAFRLAQLVLPAMRRAARGDIVMISSSEVTHARGAVRTRWRRRRWRRSRSRSPRRRSHTASG